MANQMTFNPAYYEFAWKDGWYEWDSAKAHTDARKDRDAFAKARKADGQAVKKFTERNQRMTRGGIGTPNPEIDLMVTVYGVNFG